MPDFEWCLIDTETSGIEAPIFVVEIAAQRMRGWEPQGSPFVRLLDHKTDIPPQASRVNGYTREILERDGLPPIQVYTELAIYAGMRPIGAYNLAHDWDTVLVPEWQRLGISSPAERGFCVYELTRRLIDPSPAGNHKLQTLRQFYRLPARGAHTALGDVQTVADLLAQVLSPLCEAHALRDLAAVRRFTERPWFPIRIPFGKFKGRDYREARNDPALHQWLTWLAGNGSGNGQGMGAWYLDQLLAAGVHEFFHSLTQPKVTPPSVPVVQAIAPAPAPTPPAVVGPVTAAVRPPVPPPPSISTLPPAGAASRPPPGTSHRGGRPLRLLLIGGMALAGILVVAWGQDIRFPMIPARVSSSAGSGVSADSAEPDIDIPAIPRATPQVATPVLQPPAEVRMSPPPAGSNRVYSGSEIAYCLGEQVRLETMERLISPKVEIQRRNFNALLLDYKSRCLAYRYDPQVMAVVRQDIEALRPRIMAQAIVDIRTWR